MRKAIALDYDKIAKNNIINVNARRNLHKALKETLDDKRSVILLEVPADDYATANASSVEFLLDNGFEGVYISFQRPFKNIYSMFNRFDINLDKLFVIDSATVFTGMPLETNPRCINIPLNFEIEGIVQAIFDSLVKLNSKKRFVFVDSLSTMALHKTMSETMRFSESLITKLKNKKFEDVKLLFNVAEDLTQKRYIENITVYSDEYIHLGLCT
jgi:KaiC/GvpD/RAD55 family RecA-like ATPase